MAMSRQDPLANDLLNLPAVKTTYLVRLNQSAVKLVFRVPLLASLNTPVVFRIPLLPPVFPVEFGGAVRSLDRNREIGAPQGAIRSNQRTFVVVKDLCLKEHIGDQRFRFRGHQL